MANFRDSLKIILPSNEEKEDYFTNSDLLFWDWFWQYLNQATGQNLENRGEAKWAIGGSFAIFWWECLFGIEKYPETWNDIDISLNYGNFVIIPKHGNWTNSNGDNLQPDYNIDLELTQKIPKRLEDVCGGKIIYPKWLIHNNIYGGFHKQLNDIIQLSVNLKNKKPFRLDLSFKDNSYFKLSDDGYGGGIYYFILDRPSFDGRPLVVPIFSIQTLLDIYSKHQGILRDDQSKINRLIKLLKCINEKFVVRVFYPCTVAPGSRCFGCDQRERERERKREIERDREIEREEQSLRDSVLSQEFSHGVFGKDA